MINTFRMRLTLLFTVCFAAIFFLAAFGAYSEYRNSLYETADWSLMRLAKDASEGKLDADHLERGQEIIKKVEADYHQIARHNGTAVVGSISSVSQRWPVNMDKLQKALSGKPVYDTVDSKGEKVRVIYFPAGKDEVLRMGASLEDIRQHLESLNRLIVVFPAMLLVLSFIMGWLFATRSVAPIVKLRKRAEEIIRSRTAEKIDIGRKGKEIDSIVGIFNSMIEDIHSSLEAHKRFTSDVAHEIRSPLTSLIGNTEVTLRRKRTAEEYEELLRNNLTDLVRLSRITDNILFLTKVDNHILELRKQKFDLNEFMRNIVDRFRFKAERGIITLVERYEERQLELFGDMNLLEQAFSNLIDNGIKYTSRGGSVTIGSSMDDSTVRVTISDSGVGIPEEEIPHIFDRFYRGEKENVRAVGTGLGLSITQWIIKANNGRIYVKSKVGEGSEFTVVFPVADLRQ
ncbi:MAG TPA: ATP-binding protein [Dissulfurispiraceae bacterium]|nr:ATP-binding protein [Dissulfurispiraceae bacterium]